MMDWFLLLVFWGVVAFIALVVWVVVQEQRKEAGMSPEELAEYRKANREQALTHFHGAKNPQVVCPHCQTKGTVRVKPVVQKRGISGGKAAAALLSGGTSLLVTGLSRKENATQARCDHCNCSWIF
jgi:hypothetical protein